MLITSVPAKIQLNLYKNVHGTDFEGNHGSIKRYTYTSTREQSTIKKHNGWNYAQVSNAFITSISIKIQLNI